MIAASARDAAVDATANVVTHTGTDITLDVFAVQPIKPDTTLEIAGLVDPTAKVPRGATITLKSVNMRCGNDTPHGLVITHLPTLCPSMGTMMAASCAAGTARVRATACGTYDYLCQLPGRAHEGMYGKIFVEHAAPVHRTGRSGPTRSRRADR